MVRYHPPRVQDALTDGFIIIDLVSAGKFREYVLSSGGTDLLHEPKTKEQKQLNNCTGHKTRTIRSNYFQYRKEQTLNTNRPPRYAMTGVVLL